jgi:hypothetical protein
MPTQQSHTFSSHTSRHTSQSLKKNVPAQPEKKFIFFLPSLRCFNFFSTHGRHEKTAKATIDKDYNNSAERTPACNSTYPKGGVSFSKDSFVVNQTLVFQIKFCGKSPAIRVAAKR